MRVRDRRQELGLTLEMLEERSGVTVRTLHTAERGGPCRIETVRRLADALGLAYADLWRPGPADVRARLVARGLAPAAPPEPWTPRAPFEEEVAARLTAPEPRTVCLAGPTGIGKSALAQRVCRRIADAFPEGVAWVRIRYALDGIRPLRAQLDLAEALGFAPRLPRPEEVPESAFDAAFREELWRERRLLVLDDVPSPEVARRLHGDGAVACLVTTHVWPVAQPYPDAVVLPPFPDDAARGVLRDYVGGERLDADGDGTRALLERLGGLPRAVHLAGALLAHEPGTTPGTLAERLAEDPSQGALAAVRDASLDPWERRNASLVAAYHQMARHLSEEAWDALLRFGVYGEVPVSLEWAGAACGRSSTTTRRVVRELGDLYLLQVEEETIRLDSHAAWFAAWAGREGAEATFVRVFEHALNEARGRAGAGAGGWTWFQRHSPLWCHLLDTLTRRTLQGGRGTEWEHPADVPEVAPDEEAAVRLAALVEALFPLFRVYGVREAREWLLAAFAATRGEAPGTAGRVAVLVGHWKIRCEGSVPDAWPWFDEAATLAVRAEDWTAAARAETWSARVKSSLGLQEEAIAHWRRSVEWAEAGGAGPDAVEAGRVSVAITLTHGEAAGEERGTSLELLEAVVARLEGVETMGGAGVDGVAVVREVARYDRAVLRAAEGLAEDGELERALDAMSSRFADEPHVQTRLLATALHFDVPWVDACLQRTAIRLRETFRDWVLEGDEERLEEAQFSIGEILHFLMGRSLRPDPDAHPFSRGIAPTDLFGYRPHEEVAGLPVIMLYAIEPFRELLDDASMRALSDRIVERYGPQHHIHGDLARLRSIRRVGASSR